MITITKDKIYTSPFSLKRMKKDSEDVKEVKIADVINMLGDEVELGIDATLKNLFDIIIFHKDFLNILFNKEMRGLLIDDFILDYESNFVSSFSKENFDMRFSWQSEVFEYDKEVEYMDYVAFEAFGKLDKDKDTENYPISIAFVRLCEIRDRRIVLDNTFELHDDESHENDIEAVFKANYRAFTLYELISAILHEITLYGKPEQRDNQRKEIERRIQDFEGFGEYEINEGHIMEWDEISAEIDEMNQGDFHSFWDEIYPREEKENSTSEINGKLFIMSDISNKPLEEQMKEAEELEDYETAAEIKKLIDRRESQKNKK